LARPCAYGEKAELMRKNSADGISPLRRGQAMVAASLHRKFRQKNTRKKICNMHKQAV
jgi:hypothetical protein